MQPCLPEARQPWGGPRERLMVKCPLWRLAFPAWRLEEAGGARSTTRASRAHSVLDSRRIRNSSFYRRTLRSRSRKRPRERMG